MNCISHTNQMKNTLTLKTLIKIIITQIRASFRFFNIPVNTSKYLSLSKVSSNFISKFHINSLESNQSRKPFNFFNQIFSQNPHNYHLNYTLIIHLFLLLLLHFLILILSINLQLYPSNNFKMIKSIRNINHLGFNQIFINIYNQANLAFLYTNFRKLRNDHKMHDVLLIRPKGKSQYNSYITPLPFKSNKICPNPHNKNFQNFLYSKQNLIPNLNRLSGFSLALYSSTTSEFFPKLHLSEKSLNKVQLIGRTGNDADIKVMQNGERLASFNLATTECWRDKTTGEIRSKTEWHRVAIFDPNLVEIAEKYIKRGKKLYVEGSLQTRRWVSVDGTERFTTEVILSRFKGDIMLLDGNSSGNASQNTNLNEPESSNSNNNPVNQYQNQNSSPTRHSGGLYNRVHRNEDYPDGKNFYNH